MNNFVYIVTLLLSFNTLSQQYIHDSCSSLFLPWHKNNGIMKEVNAYLLPTASPILKFDEYKHIKTLNKNEVLISEEFFLETGLEIPKDAKRIKMATYSYYPTSAITKRSSRGSGRGHILVDQPNKFTTIEFKGSGTNKYYSFANSSRFDPSDYRRNGLAVIDELTTEIIMGRILEKNGVPISMSFEMKLMPEIIQKVSRGEKGFSKSAVQVTREMNMGRESMYPGLKASLDEKMKLIGRMYSVNGQLGAINPENMTFGAKLLDLGHTNIGYPLVSGAYRCTLCKGIRGSSMDKTLVGFFDHYFDNIPSFKKFKNIKKKWSKNIDMLDRVEDHVHGRGKEINSVSWKKSSKKLDVDITYEDYLELRKVRTLQYEFDDFLYHNAEKLKSISKEKAYQAFIDQGFYVKNRSHNFILKKDTAEKFIEELTSHLGRREAIKINKDELAAIKSLLREEVKIDLPWQSIVKYGEGLTGMKLPKDVDPDQISFSFKSLMQYAGLKYTLNPVEYKELRDTLSLIVSKDYSKRLNTAIDMFEKHFKSKNLTQKDLSVLYREYQPANVIEDKIRARLDRVSSRKDLIKQTKNIVDELSAPLIINPRKYYRETLKLVPKF